MDIRRQFGDQLAFLERSAPAPELLAARLAICCFEVLPIAAAAISVVAADGFRFPVGSSSTRAAYAERLQFSTGEGPALDVRTTGDAILAADDAVVRSWPLFHAALVRHTPFRAVAAFPLIDDGTVWATVDLYLTSDEALRRLSRFDARTVVDLVGVHLSQAPPPADGWPGDPVSAARRLTRVAVRMLHTAFAMSGDDALAALRARAATRRTTVDALADAVVHQRVPLEDLVPPAVSRRPTPQGCQGPGRP